MTQNTTPKEVPQPQLLPVVNQLKESYKKWQSVLPSISKMHRQTIAGRIDKLFLDTLQYSFSATYSRGQKKIELVIRSITCIDQIKFFLLVAWESKIIKDNQYVYVSKPLSESSKMLVKWKEYLEKKTPA
jgi:hypothetical protein